ncbi:hypothetical protein RCZ01_21790 [Capnocytophaga felis]|uniref:Uncharacterized protein n=1 Tax=Capnocytophaga felis TaxID=2267611 RepID=A0A5M4BC88_9FLAO|nr:hypothetical protein RCZ01_21790 [Capnocytophaga felis]GET48579.1 hypothetical protein RCZ02_14100 [Capnocytophaga felis]
MTQKKAKEIKFSAKKRNSPFCLIDAFINSPESITKKAKKLNIVTPKNNSGQIIYSHFGLLPRYAFSMYISYLTLSDY